MGADARSRSLVVVTPDLKRLSDGQTGRVRSRISHPKTFHAVHRTTVPVCFNPISMVKGSLGVMIQEVNVMLISRD